MTVVDRHLSAPVDGDLPLLVSALDANGTTEHHLHGIGFHFFAGEQRLQHEAGKDTCAAAHHQRNLTAHAISTWRRIHESGMRTLRNDGHRKQHGVIANETLDVSLDVRDCLGVACVLGFEFWAILQRFRRGCGDVGRGLHQHIAEKLILLGVGTRFGEKDIKGRRRRRA